MLFGGANYKAAKEHHWNIASARISLGNATRKEALLGGANSGTPIRLLGGIWSLTHRL
jgi:hypothetical protein